MSSTPTLDKYNLHPCGGRCTRFSNPYSECTTCERIKEHQRRWAALSPEDRKKAEAEMKYYETSNQDGR